MNLSIKNAVLAALGVGGLIAGGAAQALDLPGSGNGSLVLFVTNTTTHQVYARDIGLHMDDLITQGTGAGQHADPTYGPVNVVNLSIGTIGPDGALSSFLTTGTTSEFTWNLIGGDTLGGISTTAPRRFALTTNTDLQTSSTLPSNNALGTLATGETNFFNQLNATLAGNASTVAADGSGAGSIQVSTAVNTFFGQAPNSTVGALGTSMNFFVLTNTPSGANGLAARVFVLNDLQLSSTGILSSVASAEVPLPAAVWLFGSGLLGMAGIGRRRKQANRQLTA